MLKLGIHIGLADKVAGKLQCVSGASFQREELRGLARKKDAILRTSEAQGCLATRYCDINHEGKTAVDFFLKKNKKINDSDSKNELAVPKKHCDVVNTTTIVKEEIHGEGRALRSTATNLTQHGNPKAP